MPEGLLLAAPLLLRGLDPFWSLFGRVLLSNAWLELVFTRTDRRSFRMSPV